MISPGLALAKVVAIHPEAYAVDLVLVSDGSPLPLVQVMTPFGSTNTGLNDLVEPTPSNSGEKYDLIDTKDRDIIAVVGIFREYPVVLGFLYPQVCQMLFAEKNRKIDRHASDVYTSVDNDGNLEVFHPSGTYFRIGTAPDHEDLTGKDFDKLWNISKNTDKAVYVHLSVKNAGDEKAVVDIDPDGNIDLQHDGNLTTQTDGDLSATVAGNATVDVTGTLDANVEGETTIATQANLNLNADGNINITATGNVVVSAANIQLN